MIACNGCRMSPGSTISSASRSVVSGTRRLMPSRRRITALDLSDEPPERGECFENDGIDAQHDDLLVASDRRPSARARRRSRGCSRAKASEHRRAAGGLGPRRRRAHGHHQKAERAHFSSDSLPPLTPSLCTLRTAPRPRSHSCVPPAAPAGLRNLRASPTSSKRRPRTTLGRGPAARRADEAGATPTHSPPRICASRSPSLPPLPN